MDMSVVKKYDAFTMVIPCDAFITSGYRTPLKNKQVGGSKHSFHLKGKAIDVSFPGCSYPIEKLAMIAKKYFNGVIVYDRHLHLDIRENKYFGKGTY